MGRSGWGWIFISLAASTVFPAGVDAAGPDVIVGDLDAVQRWGEVGGITAYSVGTISCNIGDQPLEWEDLTNQHPVIAQNMYRLKDGRLEQIGQSWVKHGFLATNENTCGICPTPGPDNLLHPGCSDPYSAGLNGNQAGAGGVGGLGPRFQVNAATGYFDFPYSSQGASGNFIYKRLQVHTADLDPAQAGGGLYFVEGHYISPDDAAAGNDNNNASYRPVTVTPLTYVVSVTGVTQQQKPAIQAWQDTDATVAMASADVAGDGRIIVAGKATDLGNGFWEYEYAVQNLNSDRSVGSFSVALHSSTPVQGEGFHDVDYHSGEPYDATDWTATRLAAALRWSTTAYGVNANANALRWGTLYNFRLRTTSPPVPNAVITLGLFKPGAPASATVSIVGPSAGPVDCNANTIADYLEIQGNPSLDCNSNGNLDECDLDCDGDDTADACEILLNPSLDCDGDGGLDTCQIPAGSPAPGGPFFCTAGCDADCNSNGVPDACDIDSLADPDCNSNGVPDSCDIAGSVSEDCNGNGVPDECEISVGSPAPGGPFFCTSGCNPDCNSNGIPDDCDIAGPLEDDCDANDIPDSCDIAAAPGIDCNSNGIIDSCGEADCNNNLIPDGCEYPACTGIVKGDYDCSGDVTEADIPMFILEIMLPAPTCLSDFDSNGLADGRDVRGFVGAI
ncbi:MAG TPA: hypothetical protein VJZ71_05135 [Phycisphaerae bacterium]|nr:hypothetical protein [Phycisphaerae bacterium]